MALCSICATDDGYSCITCQTCQTYAVLNSGILFFIKKVSAIVPPVIILIKTIRIMFIAIDVTQVVINVLDRWPQIVSLVATDLILIKMDLFVKHLIIQLIKQ